MNRIVRSPWVEMFKARNFDRVNPLLKFFLFFGLVFLIGFMFHFESFMLISVFIFLVFFSSVFIHIWKKWK